MHRPVRSAFRAILALVFALVAGAATMAHAAPPEAGREAPYTFAFDNAEVALVAQEIFGALGVRYTLDPSVTGRISFRIDQRLTRAQLLQAFETALASSDIAVVPNGDSLVLTSQAKARTSASVRRASDGVRRAGYEVVAVPLSFAMPTEVAKALEAITGPGVVLHANDRLGMLVLGGSGSQLQSALESLKIFDQNGLEATRIRWFELSQAPAAQVATEIEALLKAAGVVGVRVVPLRRLNGLILFGNTTQALDQVVQWLPRLDAPTKDTASSLWVYRPRNTSAEALARTLNSISGTQSLGEAPSTRAQMSSPTAARPSGEAAAPIESTAGNGVAAEEAIRAAVDKETNALLISAPAWRWVQLQRILAELDRPQAQVAIEATVLEVSLRNEFRLGVDWSVFADDDRLNVRLSGADNGIIAPVNPGFSVTFLGSDIQAAVSALGSRTNVEVVSAPKIVALDNRPARLQVGDEVPIITQASRSTADDNAPIVNSVAYRNSGVILSVTPRISGEDRVTVEVSQEVSSVVQTRSSGIDSPTIQQRRLESTLTLWDGGVVALGGLMSRTRDRGNSGIPGLKDVPGLGHLFRTSSRNEGRTELIVLLKVRIIRDQAGAAASMTDLASDLREIRARGMLDGR